MGIHDGIGTLLFVNINCFFTIGFNWLAADRQELNLALGTICIFCVQLLIIDEKSNWHFILPIFSTMKDMKSMKRQRIKRCGFKSSFYFYPAHPQHGTLKRLMNAFLHVLHALHGG